MTFFVTILTIKFGLKVRIQLSNGYSAVSNVIKSWSILGCINRWSLSIWLYSIKLFENYSEKYLKINERRKTQFSTNSTPCWTTFWTTIAEKKLVDLKLDERPFDTLGFFQAGHSQGINSTTFINQDSITKVFSVKVSHFLNYVANFPLSIHLVNTKKGLLLLIETLF